MGTYAGNYPGSTYYAGTFDPGIASHSAASSTNAGNAGPTYGSNYYVTGYDACSTYAAGNDLKCRSGNDPCYPGNYAFSADVFCFCCLLARLIWSPHVPHQNTLRQAVNSRYIDMLNKLEPYARGVPKFPMKRGSYYVTLRAY